VATLHEIFKKSGFDYERHIAPGATHMHDNNVYIRFPLKEMGPKLPQPEGEQYKITCFHASSMAGISGILQYKKFKTRGHEEGGAGHQGVYAKGLLERVGDLQETKALSLQRVHKAATSPKARCGIIIECRMVTRYKKLQGGGWQAEEQHVSKTTTTCMAGEKRFCFHPDNAIITGLWLAGEIRDIEDDSVTGL